MGKALFLQDRDVIWHIIFTCSSGLGNGVVFNKRRNIFMEYLKCSQ